MGWPGRRRIPSCSDADRGRRRRSNRCARAWTALCHRPFATPLSAVVHGERVDALAEPDVDMVVVAGVPAGQTLADQDRVVEVDHLDVARGGWPDGTDERSRRAAVVDGHPVVATPLALAVVATHDPDVDIHAPRMRLMTWHVAAVLEADIPDRDRPETRLPQRHRCGADRADPSARAPVHRPVADLVALSPPPEHRRLEMTDEISPRARVDRSCPRQSCVLLERAHPCFRCACKDSV